jgi:pyrroline-5-carboxylate reductase
MTAEDVMAKSSKSSSSSKSLATIPGALVLLGAGKMGGAMLEGWLTRGLPPKKVVVLEPQPSKAIKALARRGVRINPKGSVGQAAALVIAVKPQSAPEALPALRDLVDRKTLVVSIMAGRTLGFLEGYLSGAAIVRAMPNTPAAIGRGITVAVGNARVTAPARKLAHALLAASGAVEWVDDEALMDAVTAVSGSGPAYVFLLAEAMAQAGAAAGLPQRLAETLARATVAGSGELLHRSAEPAATLRQNVTSPGGTTAAALGVLMANDGLPPLMTRAVAAAAKRGKELAG